MYIIEIGINIKMIINEMIKLIVDSILAFLILLAVIINKSYLPLIIGINTVTIFENKVNTPNSLGEYTLEINGIVIINIICAIPLDKTIIKESFNNLFFFMYYTNCLTIFAGFPAITTLPSSKLFVTIEPAPTIVLSPKLTPGNITEFIPNQQFLPRRTSLPSR